MLNVVGIDSNDNLYLVLELFEQSDFIVWLIAWQDAGSMEVFQHFTAEFHVKFALKLINALQDMVALQV